ncbi:MAG TPA: tRNA (adenosine(37)-N6)-threonylcarbamoyltransferase complex dimerization subunit type 1 TsaB [Rhizomicrobium sp.]|jgi:tRNA threonylcarbamoyladenosine biosynthesis protein TsaB
MKILAVDTALGACSAVLLDSGRIAAHRFVFMDRGHAEALAPMVEGVMREAGIAFAALDRLAVTTGPGTFTGQRVGLAFMRGLRVALKKPLTGITSLAAMAEAAKAETGLVRAAVFHDARREEFYAALGGEPMLMARNDVPRALLDFADDKPLALAGTAAPWVAENFAGGVLSSIRQPDALWVARLAAAMAPDDAIPRPLYLRAPDAKLPTKVTP